MEMGTIGDRIKTDVRHQNHPRNQPSNDMQEALEGNGCTGCDEMRYVVGFSDRGPVYDHGVYDHV
jgi:hypothetical protein